MKKKCDIAKGELTHNGYIRIQRTIDGKRKKVRAHREAWEKAHGPIPEGKLVLHQCDNRACREVTHLFLGSHQDNANDRVSKGRQAKGESGGMSRLSKSEALAIKTSTEPGAELAKRFGVSQAHISRIKTGRQWKHLIG